MGEALESSCSPLPAQWGKRCTLAAAAAAAAAAAEAVGA
jgi:hypothetical protein